MQLRFTAAVLISCCGLLSGWPNSSRGDAPAPGEIEPSAPAGTNSLSGLKVSQLHGSAWIVDFDYSFSGTPRGAALCIELGPESSTSEATAIQSGPCNALSAAEIGTHHVHSPLNYPGMQSISREVSVSIRNPVEANAVLVRQTVNQVIEWPTYQTWFTDQTMAQATPTDNFHRAVALIDTDQPRQLAEAKSILERLIGENPRFDAAYVELARVAMKTNWGPDGLHQAETLISSALQIHPDSVDAKILLGYVYTNQHRYAQAEELFIDAARANPANLWLWDNWGELLTLEGRYDESIAKYRVVLEHPMTHDSNYRARNDAYGHILALLEQRRDFTTMETLYKQRVAEFGPGSCYSTDYAKFLIQVRGDIQGAIDLSRRALNQDCDDAPARQVLGLAEYVKWAETPGAERAEALAQARIYLPAGPTALYQLATSDRTLDAARRLITAGEPVDQHDGANMTALAYALQDRDYSAASHLLSLGAQPEVLVGPLAIPVALMPVIEADVSAVRLMQEHGVDYSQLKYHGETAFDIAKAAGNEALLAQLGRKNVAL